MRKPTELSPPMAGLLVRVWRWGVENNAYPNIYQADPGARRATTQGLVYRGLAEWTRDGVDRNPILTPEGIALAAELAERGSVVVSPRHAGRRRPAIPGAIAIGDQVQFTRTPSGSTARRIVVRAVVVHLTRHTLVGVDPDGHRHRVHRSEIQSRDLRRVHCPQRRPRIAGAVHLVAHRRQMWGVWIADPQEALEPDVALHRRGYASGEGLEVVTMAARFPYLPGVRRKIWVAERLSTGETVGPLGQASQARIEMGRMVAQDFPGGVAGWSLPSW